MTLDLFFILEYIDIWGKKIRPAIFIFFEKLFFTHIKELVE